MQRESATKSSWKPDLMAGATKGFLSVLTLASRARRTFRENGNVRNTLPFSDTVGRRIALSGAVSDGIPKL